MPRIESNGVGNMEIATKKNNRSDAKSVRKPKKPRKTAEKQPEAFARITESSIFEKHMLHALIPIKTISEANCFQPWRTKYQRHETQKKNIYWTLSPIKQNIKLPCTVLMIRHAPGSLDEDDNLRMALKWIKDAIAELLTGDYIPGRADNNKEIKWQYQQEKKDYYAVEVKIFF